LLLIIRDAMRKKSGSDEALSFALGLGAFISMASLIAASKVGEQSALYLHASEALLLLGATILLVIENDKKLAASTADTGAADMPRQVYLSSSPSS